MQPPIIRPLSPVRNPPKFGWLACLKPLKALLALTVLIGLAFGVMPQAQAADAVGKVAKQRADAYGTPIGGSRERKFPRYDVTYGELIETAGGAAILIKLDDDTQLFLGERAQLTIDSFVYNPKTKKGEAVYNFTQGALRFISGSMKGNKVSIVTPTASLGIRGSEAVIFVEENGATTLNVIAGAFRVRSRERPDDPPRTVTARRNITVSAKGAISKVGKGMKVPKSAKGGKSTKVQDFEGQLKDLKTGGRFERQREGTRSKASKGHDDHHDDDDDHHDDHGD